MWVRAALVDMNVACPALKHVQVVAWRELATTGWRAAPARMVLVDVSLRAGMTHAVYQRPYAASTKLRVRLSPGI